VNCLFQTLYASVCTLSVGKTGKVLEDVCVWGSVLLILHCNFILLPLSVRYATNDSHMKTVSFFYPISTSYISPVSNLFLNQASYLIVCKLE